MSAGRRSVGLVALGLAAVALASVTIGLLVGGRDARVLPVDPAAHFPPEQQELAAAYAGVKYSYWAAGTILRWGFLVALIAMGGGPALARLGRRIARGRRFPAAFLTAFLLFGMLAVATLPIALQSGWRTERAFGLTGQTVAGWLADWLREGGFWIALYSVLAAGFLLVIERWPERGWRIAAAGGVLVAVAGLYAAPRVIDPLFHHFAPIEDAQLEAQIQELGRRADVAIDRVRVMDASRRTNRLNAYVTGLGATHQVVLYDNLVDNAPRPEVLLVVGHEIGHTADRHLQRGLLLVLPLIVLGAWAVSGLARVQARERGFASPGDPAGLPLLWLAVSTGLFMAAPAINGFQRGMEADADWTSLEITRDPQTYVATAERLTRANLMPMEPPRWLVFWLYSHPPILDRLGMAKYWAAENPRLPE